MVFSATFNNIPAILWWSVLLVEETRVPEGNHRHVTSHWQTLSPLAGFKLTTLVVIGTDCTSSCKSNYHTITTMTTPRQNYEKNAPTINFFQYQIKERCDMFECWLNIIIVCQSRPVCETDTQVKHTLIFKSA